MDPKGTLEILESLQKQLDTMIFEPHSEIDEKLRNALAIIVSVLRDQCAKPS